MPLLADQLIDESFRRNTKISGVWVFPTGSSTRLEDYDQLFVGGLRYHWRRFVDFANDHQMPGYYIVPSYPLFKDIYRIIGIKFFGKSDPFATELAESMKSVNKKITVYALSQGVLTTVNAIEHHGLSNEHNFVFFSPAVSYPTVRRYIPKDRLYYFTPWFDSSSTWAPSCNPLKFLSGVIDVAGGFYRHRRQAMTYHMKLYRRKRERANGPKIGIDFGTRTHAENDQEDQAG